MGQGICNEQYNTPTKISEEKLSLVPERVVQINGGATYSLVLDSLGKIYICGKINLNAKDPNEIVYTFKKIASCENIIFSQIACGWDFSVGISKYSKLFVWGSNSFNQLGLSKDKYPFISEPILVNDISVKFVACGLRHMAVITLDNKLKICGSNTHGQLGLVDAIGNSLNVECFTDIPNLENIKTVACGQKHTVALNFRGEIFVWGDNKWGQLGFSPKLIPKSKKPIKLTIPKLNDPIKLFCGWTHNVILTASGHLWSWGRNNYGQLGRRCDENNSWLPEKIQLNDVERFSIGAEHNLAVASNKLYSWGWNEHGNCGNGCLNNIFEPTIIDSNVSNKTIYCIGCGTGQSFAISK